MCHDCKALIEDGRRFRAAALKKNAPVQAVLIPWRWYALPYLSHNRDELQMAFYQLVELLSSDAPEGIDMEKLPSLLWEKGRGHAQIIRLMQPALLPVLELVWKEITLIVERAYDKGKEEGSSIIMGLAKGEVTISDFNKATAGKPLKKK